MAVRQYVGARYVPKFWDNGSGSTEWTPNIPYESLVVVTYLGNSYTSKVPVPATAVAPNVDTEHWALTGAYNAQVEQYRQEVEELKNKVGATYYLSDIVKQSGTNNVAEAISGFVNYNDKCCIYVDKYIYDIDTITIPTNCQLFFCGGGFDIKGVLTIQSEINAPLYQIFYNATKTNLIVNRATTGTGYPEWVGNNLQLACDLFAHVQLQATNYFISENLYINKSNFSLTGKSKTVFWGDENGGSRIIEQGTARVIVGTETTKVINELPRCITIKDIEIDGGEPTYPAMSVYGNVGGMFKNIRVECRGDGIEIVWTVGCNFIDCNVQITNAARADVACYRIGHKNVKIAAGENASLRMVRCFANKAGGQATRGFWAKGYCADIYFIDCETSQCDWGFQIEGDMHSDLSDNADIRLSGCVVDQCAQWGLCIAQMPMSNVNISDMYIASTAESNNALIYIDRGGRIAMSNLMLYSMLGIGIQCLTDAPHILANGAIYNGGGSYFVNTSEDNTNVFYRGLNNGNLVAIN